MRPIFWILYQAAAVLALLAAGPVLLLRRGRHYLPALAGRLGRRDRAAAGDSRGATGGALWLHAVSVGEVGVAATLVRALPADLPLLVTTVTPAGQARARAAFAGRAEVAYLPFDFGPAVRGFLGRFTPRALVLVEGDYWPLLLREAKRRGMPVAVVNGRVGDRSFRRLLRLRRLRLLQPILAALFTPVDRFGLQSGRDRERLLALGVAAERLAVTGNLKYDSPEPAALPELAAAVARLARGRPILVAGSTMAGEEEQVLDAFAELGGGGRALLLLAPRHPERWGEVALLLHARGVAYERRTRLTGAAVPAGGGQDERPADGPSDMPDVLLLDSMGELAALYRHAAAAFIGGTLVATGGHNPLEAARWGVPLAVGPSMHNFRDMAEQFDRAAAWRRVADSRQLARAWGQWLSDPAVAAADGRRAGDLLIANRGALAHTMALLAPLLAGLEAGGQEWD